MKSNEIHTCTVMFWMDCAFIRKKLRAWLPFLWPLNGFIWELVDFDKKHSQIVETGLNVMDSSGVRSRLVCQVGQDEAFVVSHLSSQFILLLVRLERE